MPESRPILSSAKLIALCTLLSRVTGLVRDMLVLHAFGQKWVADAFWYAFQFPNLFRRLFGEGALAAVFVPAFTRTLETQGRPAAWALLSRTVALLTLVLVAITVAVEFVILAIWTLAPAATPDAAAARGLLCSLTAIMLPFMISICVLALLSSVLNCVGSFVPGALASVVLNAVMIAALLAAPRLSAAAEGRVHWVAWSVVLAGVLQLALLLPALRRSGVELGWKIDSRDAGVRSLMFKLGPALLGQGVLLIGTFLDTQVCVLLTSVGEARQLSALGVTVDYPLQEGALTAVNAAARLYQFPLGVLVISLATAALPAFSRMATREDWPAWAGEIRQMLRLALFEGLLAGAMMIVLAGPIIRLLFEHGAFDAAATERSARVLAWYGVGMWAFCAQHIVLRAFYSVGDVRTPLRIAAALVPANLLLSLLLVWLPGVRESAFAISSAATSGVSVVVGMAVLARRRGVRLADAATLAVAARMIVAAAAGAALVFGARQMLSALAGDDFVRSLAGRAIEALGGLALGAGCTLAIAAALRVGEANQLVRVVLGSRWRSERS